MKLWNFIKGGIESADSLAREGLSVKMQWREPIDDALTHFWGVSKLEEAG
jgi:hypothetical protein